MSHENIIFWLKGFLEGKDTLNTEELLRIKEIIGVPTYPSKGQIEKMLNTLFPDLKGTELRKAMLEYKER